ncbi:hypothetical protein Lser_V15G31856 [Lactuca serriola]
MEVERKRNGIFLVHSLRQQVANANFDDVAVVLKGGDGVSTSCARYCDVERHNDVKCVATIRLMGMVESPDTMDDYMRMFERTARKSLYTLSRGVVATFGDVYLRKPSLHDLQELYATHEERHGFPEMIGSIDCTHWKWKNCLSPIFDNLLNGNAPDTPFTVNGNKYKYGYITLQKDIYSQYSTFVKAFRHPVEERDNFFKRRQEGARKDVERAFGVLKAK